MNVYLNTKITLNVLYCVQKYKNNKIYKKYKSVENNKIVYIFIIIKFVTYKTIIANIYNIKFKLHIILFV